MSSVAVREQQTAAEGDWLDFGETLPRPVAVGAWIEDIDEAFEYSDHPVVSAMRAQLREGTPRLFLLAGIAQHEDFTPDLSEAASRAFDEWAGE